MIIWKCLASFLIGLVYAPLFILCAFFIPLIGFFFVLGAIIATGFYLWKSNRKIIPIFGLIGAASFAAVFPWLSGLGNRLPIIFGVLLGISMPAVLAYILGVTGLVWLEMQRTITPHEVSDAS